MRLHLGTLGVESTSNEARVFELSPTNRLSFRAVAPDFLSLLVTSSISTNDRIEALRVIDNHVQVHNRALIEFRSAAGQVHASTIHPARFTPDWFLPKMRAAVPDFALDGRLTLIDLEVVAPGKVRVLGTWADAGNVVCITREALFFCKPSLDSPSIIIGAGPDSTILKCDGSLTSAALFGFMEQRNSALKV
jgi:hypothetical protein